MRPHREALTRHTTPMNPSDVVHKTVFKVGRASKPSAKTNHGTHQRRHALHPLHSRSRSELRDLDMSVTIFQRFLDSARNDKAVRYPLGNGREAWPNT